MPLDPPLTKIATGSAADGVLGLFAHRDAEGHAEALDELPGVLADASPLLGVLRLLERLLAVEDQLRDAVGRRLAALQAAARARDDEPPHPRDGSRQRRVALGVEP